MRGILSILLDQKIPAHVATSDGKEYYGSIVGLPSTATGPAYDYIIIQPDNATKRVYISSPYVVSVTPDREPDAVERDRHGDPIKKD